MKLNNILKYGLVLAIPAMSLVSCVSSGDNQGWEFAPQMYVSDAYEPFSQEEGFTGYNPNNMTMRLPVNGTVARGQVGYIYPYANTGEGYEASASYTSSMLATQSNVAEGKRLYDINCSHCHGKSGKNDGAIFKSKKMPGPSWKGLTSDYFKNLPDGKVYHVITHGKGLMGPHAAFLSPEERWKVIHHLRKLSLGDAFEFDPEQETSLGADGSDANGENGTNMDGANGSSNNGAGANFPGTNEERQLVLNAMSKVMFKVLPNRKELKASSFVGLDELAKLLVSNSDWKAVVVGRTGTTVTEDGAENLSQERANTVVNYLVSKGVDSGNLVAKAGGDDTHTGENMTSEGRQSNRRVEIEIYK